MSNSEERFLLGSGVFLGTIKHLPEEEKTQLIIESMSDEAITTSEIEGEILNRQSVQSSIRRQLGLAGEIRKATGAEQGISQMMVDLFRGYAQPLTKQTLFQWHAMIMQDRADLANRGSYRTHQEPMQIVSGQLGAPNVHFEAPPSEQVAAEMDRFLEWFDKTAPGTGAPLPPLTRAGIAHLYFESIHPFEDGNGRIGRAIAEKVITQSLGQPSLTAIAATILANRKSYYEALEAANKHNEITAWLAWFAAMGLEAQERTLAQIEFLIEKTKLLDRTKDKLNPRQSKALHRMLREGIEGFKGGLSASKYMTITQASSATATRDLAEMIDLKALVRTGEKRHTRYQLPIPIRPIAQFTIDDFGDVNQLVD